jgi:hypothetical protein
MNGSKIYNAGRAVCVEYPEVYFQFVSELKRNHPEIESAMMQAGCDLSNGSAFEFLNLILSCTVEKNTPMEIGYAKYLDALKMRRKTPQEEANLRILVAKYKDVGSLIQGHDGKPMFPDKPNQ